MPKASKSSAWEEAQVSTQQETNETSQDELPSSDKGSDTEVTFNPPRQQPQVVPSMFMPYIEGPKMDWTVNDGLYHRFLKWHLKCENILECELAALPTDQLTTREYNGENLKISASCNQMKYMQGLTSSQASGKEIGVLMNGIMWYKLRSI